MGASYREVRKLCSQETISRTKTSKASFLKSQVPRSQEFRMALSPTHWDRSF